ncbi:MAG: hypothetical protein I3273_07190 [Candidatus Moeniiplasma glomeromycotorum]|nr:hypothetical protein [Candidatus Moeniiplasma glomeromycotorum]MCE8168375.1 hypothetical protein [Candidatus Moeniiplasma glomeromycotorum]MCE8169871.1 hypothetical protein [Candidatus Moeniiplasma glomeromycotorum]
MLKISPNYPKNSPKLTYQKKELLIISLALLLHGVGILVAFFRFDIRFDFNLLRFFSWWSVHTSILSVLAAILIFRENRKKNSSYFTQFIILLATLYNLITFFFWIYCLFSPKLSVEWEKSLLFNCQLVSWHLIAPLLTLFYFFFYARIDQLRKKIIKTLLFIPIAPIFYFFYVWTLAKLNYGITSSLFPHLPKYPYFIFEWIAEVRWNWFIINFLIALLTFISLCSFVIWIKIIISDWKNKTLKK